MISGYSGLASVLWTLGPFPFNVATMLDATLAMGWSGLVVIPPLATQEGSSLSGVTCHCSTRDLMARGCVCGAMAFERAQSKST